MRRRGRNDGEVSPGAIILLLLVAAASRADVISHIDPRIRYD